MTHGFRSLCVNNDTFFKDIKMISASTILSINQKLKIKIKPYWKPENTFKKSDLSYAEATLLTKEKIRNVFMKRFRSDYPMACLLSGGVDSSSIAAVAKTFKNIDLKCYSISAENK